MERFQLLWEVSAEIRRIRRPKIRFPKNRQKYDDQKYDNQKYDEIRSRIRFLILSPCYLFALLKKKSKIRQKYDGQKYDGSKIRYSDALPRNGKKN